MHLVQVLCLIDVFYFFAKFCWTPAIEKFSCALSPGMEKSFSPEIRFGISIPLEESKSNVKYLIWWAREICN